MKQILRNRGLFWRITSSGLNAANGKLNKSRRSLFSFVQEVHPMKHVPLQIGAASIVAVLALVGTGRAAPYSVPSAAVASAAAEAARSASEQSRAAVESSLRDIRDRLQAERRGAKAMARANETRSCAAARTLSERRACARAAYYR
jgi:hypothetical protein